VASWMPRQACGRQADHRGGDNGSCGYDDSGETGETGGPTSGPAPRAGRARPAGDAVRRLQRRPAAGRRRPRRRSGQRPWPAAPRGGAAPRRRGRDQPRGGRDAGARPRRELLVLRAALPRHAGGAGLGLPAASARLPPGAHHAGARDRDRAGRLRAAADGAAADAARLRRRPRDDVGARLVGERRQRPQGARRPHQRAGRDAVPARRLGPVVRLGCGALHPYVVAARARVGVRRRDGAGGGGDRQPLRPRRRGRRAGGHRGRPRHPNTGPSARVRDPGWPDEARRRTVRSAPPGEESRPPCGCC
jgi:hypothetical protein